MTQRDKSYAQRIREERMGRTYGPLPKGGNAAAYRTDDGGFRNDQGFSGGDPAKPARSFAKIARDAMERGVAPRFDGQEPQGFKSAKEAREAAEARARWRSLNGG